MGWQCLRCLTSTRVALSFFELSWVRGGFWQFSLFLAFFLFLAFWHFDIIDIFQIASQFLIVRVKQKNGLKSENLELTKEIEGLKNRWNSSLWQRKKEGWHRFLKSFAIFVKLSKKIFSLCPVLTKLALDLHVNFRMCSVLCVLSRLFFKASDWLIYKPLTVVLAPFLSN